MAAGLRIGRYELGERLGTGGFGVVYHARDTELGRELAIKVLRPEYQTQPDVIARFLKEARAAAKIDHPGIVTVFECGTISGSGTAQDGNAYIAMELLRGYSLTQHLEQRGRLSVADAILIARQVAAALAVAHAAGIVHRDLKPDNVFLLPDPLVKGGFRIKILDFGVAKLAEPKEVGVNTHSQMMLGTPKYMSPEQARSARAVDQRTDVYTLGCMLYEMLTAQAPYEGPGAIDMIIQHTTAPIPSPRSIVQGLPESMDKLIRQMLGKEPDDRPPSMQAIDKALEEIQLEVAPPSGPQRPKPPTSPPAIPRTPARPTPAPPTLAEPTGLTPTPPIATMRNSRPTPAPPTMGIPTTPSPPTMTGSPGTPLRAPARPTPAPPLMPPPRPTPASREASQSSWGTPASREASQSSWGTPASREASQSSWGTPASREASQSSWGTPQPPQRPSPVAVGTVADSSPFANGALATSLEDAPTTSAAVRTTSRRAPPKSRTALLVAVGAIAAGLAATVVFFMLRKEPAATTPRDQPAAASSDAGIDVAQLRTECADLEKTLFWKELKECADRLKTYDRALADKLWKKADDEAANEKKYKALQDYVQKKDFEKARVLVKRIEESVYTERAHKLLDEAEAAAKMP